MRRWLVPFVVVVVAAILGSLIVVVAFGDDDSAAATVVLEPVNTTGTDPFTDSVAIDETTDLPSSVTAVSATLATDPQTGGLTARGATPGLYGGTRDETVCDPDQLVTFLDQNPDKAAAWAAVLGIRPANIKNYVAGLTPVVLTTDTRVTNHGYKNGEATTLQSILQAGTAVLVDARGVPRVKCGCGNPLTPPTTNTAAPIGNPWPGYQPDQVTTITPNPRPVTTLTLTDITTGTPYQQDTGTTPNREDNGPSDGEWIAVAGNELTASKDDGKTWSVIGSTEQSDNTWINEVAYGDGMWVGVGGLRASDDDAEGDLGGAIFTSEDARTWQQVATVDHQLGSVAYGDGMWTALGSWETAGWFFTSTDGSRWEQSAMVTPPTTQRFTPLDLAFGDDTWVALALEEPSCSSGYCPRTTLMTSPDAISWTITDVHFQSSARIAHGDRQWLVAGADFGSTAASGPVVISSSRDLKSWSDVSPSPSPSVDSPVIAFGGGTWLLAATSRDQRDTLLSSPDGRRWVPAGPITRARSRARRLMTISGATTPFPDASFSSNDVGNAMRAGGRFDA